MTAAQFQALPRLGYGSCGHWWVPDRPGAPPAQYPGQAVVGCGACGQWWPLETN